jgi:SPASM domain peptide maturase of grasp-with-spasm system
MNSIKYFNLYSCCKPVLGASRSIICDLQRDIYIPTPNALYHIIGENRIIEMEKVFEDYGKENTETILEYFNYLLEKELGFFSENKIEELQNINFENYYEPKRITNSIIDITNDYSWLDSMINQLSKLNCEAVELRLFNNFSISEIDYFLEKFENTSIRSVEILTPYIKGITKKKLIDLRLKHSRLRKIIVHSAKINDFYDHFEFYVFFIKEIIVSKKCCGVVNPYYFVSKTDFFIEAKNYNSCLNRKISIDEYGNIKNCPSMQKSFGNIKDVNLENALNNPEFKKYWKVNKDQIEICKDCEFRYICTDCRAYTQNPDNEYSKPLKCGYNPYQNIWQDWSTNPLKEYKL